MGEILNKLTSYNIFNYLMPGILFCAIADSITSYQFVHDDVLIGLFAYYFSGMVISRIGSIMVEPAFKCIKLVTYAPYDDFVAASKLDEKIVILSESNNTYRTIVAMMFVLVVVISVDRLVQSYPNVDSFVLPSLFLSLFGLFIYSYRKQSSYVKRRVEKTLTSVRGQKDG